jgi:hypothetical protein
MASNVLKAICGAAVLTALSVAPAAAQFSWDPVDEVLGTIGITAKERPHIDYRERAPLVVPKSGTLPPPQDTNAIRGQRWPNDPDVAARRRKAEEARAPSTTDYEGRVIRDAKGRNRYAGVPSAPAGGGDGAYNPARAVSRDQVRQLNAEAALAAQPYQYGEPKRETLTDPPKGYRAAQGGQKVRATVDPMRTGDDLQINIMQPRN